MFYWKNRIFIGKDFLVKSAKLIAKEFLFSLFVFIFKLVFEKPLLFALFCMAKFSELCVAAQSSDFATLPLRL